MKKRNVIIFGLCFILAAQICLAAAKGLTDWPMWRGDAARSAAIDTPLPENLKPIWIRHLGVPQPAWPESQYKIRFDVSYEPVVVGKRIFVPSMVNDRLTAYDTDTGNEIWRFYADAPLRFAPVVWRDMVFIAGDDGRLYALDAATGQTRWSKLCAPRERWIIGNHRLISMWPVRGAPVLVEEANGGATIYLAAGLWPFMGTFIYALDAATGNERWCNSGSGAMYVMQQHDSPAFAGVAPHGYSAVGKDVLVISGGRTVPAGYDRHTGDFLHFNVGSRAYGNSAGGYVVSATDEFIFNNNCIYALKTGAPVHKANGRANRIGDSMYAFSSSKGITVYGTKFTQSEKESIDRKGNVKRGIVTGLDQRELDVFILSQANIHFKAGKRLFVSNAGTIFSVDVSEKADKERVWKTEVKGTVWRLLPGDNKLFVVTEEGDLLAYGDVAGGARVMEYRAPAPKIDPAAPIAGPEGYAMVWGLEGNNIQDRLTRLAKRYHVIGIDPDINKVQSLRHSLDDAGWYGHRIHLIADDPQKMQLPSYLANLIEVRMKGANGALLVKKAWQRLRPYGGTALFRDPYKPAEQTWNARLAALFAPAQAAAPGAADSISTIAQAAELIQKTDASASVMVDLANGLVNLSRPNAVPRSADWTHQYADVANTTISRDDNVKLPLGLLWFGGPSNDDILPRHGHGPSPQVIEGRVIIEGPNALRAVDAYSGRLLWQRAFPGLGTFYDNTNHQPGANEIGSNYVSEKDGIYVVYNRQCLRLDPVTGDTLGTFTLPAPAKGKPLHWGYIGVYDKYLIASSAPISIKLDAIAFETEVTHDVPYSSTSSKLFVLDRYTGKILWQRAAKLGFRHNAIVAARGKVFCIDGLSETLFELLRYRSGNAVHDSAEVLALDIKTGEVVWKSNDHVFGTWLGYSEKHDLLIEAGSFGRDRARDEAYGKMAAYKGSTGKLVWREQADYQGVPMLHNDIIYTEGAAFSLLTGKTHTRINPISGKRLPWKFSRNYGCNTPIGGQHLIVFRSAAAGFYDLANDGGTGNWGGFKSGCSPNLIPAGGIMSAPDYTRTCTCSYQNQCSLAFEPMPDVEVWTFQGWDRRLDAIHSIAINFGAPGDWPAPDGTLWFEYPEVGGRSPNLGITTKDTGTYFRHHSLLFEGPAKQVAASGVEGEVPINLALSDGIERSYRLRLVFAEPTAQKAGERVFDVMVQGKPLLKNFDIFAQAGGKRRSIIKEFSGIAAKSNLKIELRSVTDSSLPPLLCGMAVEREEPISLQFDLQQSMVADVPDAATGSLSLSNRLGKAVSATLEATLAGKAIAKQAIKLAPGQKTIVPLKIPLAQVNGDNLLEVSVDLGKEFEQFRLITDEYSLQAYTPLALDFTQTVASQVNIGVRSKLTDKTQNPKLVMMLDGKPLQERALTVTPTLTEHLICQLPQSMIETQANFQVRATWPLAEGYLPKTYTYGIDLGGVKIVPRKKGSDPVKTALTLDSKDSFYPENQRASYAGMDDMQANVEWAWDGDSLLVRIKVKDDKHFNNIIGESVWNGDALVLGIASAEFDTTVIALALTKDGVQLKKLTGSNATLEEQLKGTVERNDKTGETVYQLNLPLSAVGIAAAPGGLLRLNLAILDDDDGKGYFYWRQLAPGIVGRARSENYPLFVLGE